MIGGEKPGPKPKKKKRPLPRGRKRRPGGGRSISTDTARVTSYGRTHSFLRITLSEDLVEMLIDMHDKVFGGMLRRTKPKKDEITHYEGTRLEFARLMDMSIPAIFLRVEPPSFDPKGYRLFRPGGRGRQYCVQIKASRVGVKDNIATCRLETMLQQSAPNLFGGGMLLLFPDEAMIYDGPKARIGGLKESLIVNRRAELARERRLLAAERQQEAAEALAQADRDARAARANRYKPRKSV